MRPEDQNQSHQQQTEKQSTNDPIAESKSVTVSGAFCCPECGGTRIRKRSSLIWFLVAIAGMAIILSLQNVFMLLSLKNVTLILSFGLMFVLCAACVFVWMLLFRNSLCKSCGHRFPTGLGIRQEQDPIAFPLRFLILSYIMILLLGITSADELEYLFYGSVSYFLFIVILVEIEYGFFAAFSVQYQLGLYFLLRKKIKNQLIWIVLFLLPVFLIGSYSLYTSISTETQAASILSDGRLADLPESATNVKVYSWSSLFSGEWFLKFQASPEDIDKFVNNSPSIKDQECITYSPEKMRLPSPEDREKWHEYFEAGHEMYRPDSMAPKWYRPEIRVRGREYGVPPVGCHYNGEVIVDDEKNIVYIKIIWS